MKLAAMVAALRAQDGWDGTVDMKPVLDALLALPDPVREAARKVAEAGPFYNGVDDDFCAVCGAYFLLGQDHKDDCVYVELCRLLDVSV